MKWTAVFVSSILFAIISALAGLTAGINLNPKSTVIFVPNWGSVGDWISGIGAIFAVAVALWQTYKQQKKEQPKVSTHQIFDDETFTVHVLSEGIVPASILSASISYNNGSTVENLSDWFAKNFSLPQKLERGEVALLLNLEKRTLEKLSISIGSRLTTKILERGIKPVIYLKNTNSEYFDELEKLAKQPIHLIIRTANQDIKIPFQRAVVESIANHIVKTELEKRESELAHSRAEMLELASLLEAHRPKD